MESKARILGHGAHPLLIVFPLGLLSTAVIFDIVYLVTGSQGATILAFWLIAAGVIGGLVAAVPGLIDWVAIIPANTRAKSVGLIHGVGNVVVVLLFAVSWWLRRDAEPGFNMAGRPDTLALICSFAGFVLALGTGWLGGELIERLGIAVHPGAHPNAPSSLSNRPATENSDSVM
ncbi:MAG: DUF2231 domain-containing protein [Pyrinomonadaceae bacterium]